MACEVFIYPFFSCPVKKWLNILFKSLKKLKIVIIIIAIIIILIIIITVIIIVSSKNSISLKNYYLKITIIII